MPTKYSKNAQRHVIDAVASTSAICSLGLAVGILSLGLNTAIAANGDSSGACSEIRSRVLAAESRGNSDPSRLREARYFANEGKSLCETEHSAEGADKYRQALGVLEGSSAEAVHPVGGQS